MLYKPRFCCHCGDEIERVNWRFRDSRRFCDICETDHVLDDWSGVIACVIFVATFVIFYPTNENIDEFRPGRVRLQSRGGDVRVPSTSNSVEEPRGDIASEPEPIPDSMSEPAPAPKPKLDSFCGVLTRKGTPCTRKVRKGEKCWQHRSK